MSYLIQTADRQWVGRGKPVAHLRNASIYPHPSAAKRIQAKYPGSTLIPFSKVRDAWLKDREAS